MGVLLRLGDVELALPAARQVAASESMTSGGKATATGSSSGAWYRSGW